MSESHQNYVISSNLGSLNSFENISGKESPCLVLKECQSEASTENEDFRTLNLCTKPHNNSNLISTAMNLIEKCSDNVNSNISLTTSPLESDSPDQVRSKLDHSKYRHAVYSNDNDKGCIIMSFSLCCLLITMMLSQHN